MAIEKATVTPEPRPYERVVKTTCELCGKTHNDSDPEDWGDGIYEVAEVNISLDEGNRYPEGKFTDKLVIDMCPDCFKDKLIPWVKSQGGNAREEDSGY